MSPPHRRSSYPWSTSRSGQYSSPRKRRSPERPYYRERSPPRYRPWRSPRSPRSPHSPRAGRDRDVQIDERFRGDVVAYRMPESTEALSATFTRNGEYAIYGSKDGYTRICRVGASDKEISLEILSTIEHPFSVYQSRMSDDGYRVVTATFDGNIRIYQRQGGTSYNLVTKLSQYGLRNSRAVCISQSGQFVIATFFSGARRPDSNGVMISSFRCRVILYEVGSQTEVFSRNFPGMVDMCRMSRGAQVIAVGFSCVAPAPNRATGNDIILMNFQGTVIARFTDVMKFTRSCLFWDLSENGEMFAMIQNDAEIALHQSGEHGKWNGAPVLLEQPDADFYFQLRFTQCCKYLIAVSKLKVLPQARVTVYSMDTKEILFQVDDHLAIQQPIEVLPRIVIAQSRSEKYGEVRLLTRDCYPGPGLTMVLVRKQTRAWRQSQPALHRGEDHRLLGEAGPAVQAEPRKVQGDAPIPSDSSPDKLASIENIARGKQGYPQRLEVPPVPPAEVKATPVSLEKTRAESSVMDLERNPHGSTPHIAHDSAQSGDPILIKLTGLNSPVCKTLPIPGEAHGGHKELDTRTTAMEATSGADRGECGRAEGERCTCPAESMNEDLPDPPSNEGGADSRTIEGLPVPLPEAPKHESAGAPRAFTDAVASPTSSSPVGPLNAVTRAEVLHVQCLEQQNPPFIGEEALENYINSSPMGAIVTEGTPKRPRKRWSTGSTLAASNGFTTTGTYLKEEGVLGTVDLEYRPAAPVEIADEDHHAMGRQCENNVNALSKLQSEPSHVQEMDTGAPSEANRIGIISSSSTPKDCQATPESSSLLPRLGSGQNTSAGEKDGSQNRTLMDAEAASRKAGAKGYSGLEHECSPPAVTEGVCAVYTTQELAVAASESCHDAHEGKSTVAKEAKAESSPLKPNIVDTQGHGPTLKAEQKCDGVQDHGVSMLDVVAAGSENVPAQAEHGFGAGATPVSNKEEVLLHRTSVVSTGPLDVDAPSNTSKCGTVSQAADLKSEVDTAKDVRSEVGTGKDGSADWGLESVAMMAHEAFQALSKPDKVSGKMYMTSTSVYQSISGLLGPREVWIGPKDVAYMVYSKVAGKNNEYSEEAYLDVVLEVFDRVLGTQRQRLGEVFSEAANGSEESLIVFHARDVLKEEMCRLRLRPNWEDRHLDEAFQQVSQNVVLVDKASFVKAAERILACKLRVAMVPDVKSS